MSELLCSHCGQKMSAAHTVCNHCGKKISFWRDVKASVEQNRWYQALLVVFVVFLLGCAWYIRANTGLRWPLFAIVILCAPLVPWLLQLAYKSASPLNTGDKGNEGSKSTMQAEAASNLQGEVSPHSSINKD